MSDKSQGTVHITGKIETAIVTDCGDKACFEEKFVAKEQCNSQISYITFYRRIY